MSGIYQVIVRGRRLESRDLRKLLARAVAEKRIMDQKLRLFGSLVPGGRPVDDAAVQASLLVPENATR